MKSNSLLGQIKANKSKIFRRIYIKRRETTTGLFESGWTEISDDILTWGKVVRSVDAQQYNKFKFGGVRFQVANDSGRYNPETNPSSLWFGFLSPQRSLVRIEAGFSYETQTASGLWKKWEWPIQSVQETVTSFPVGAPGAPSVIRLTSTASRLAIQLSAASVDLRISQLGLPYAFRSLTTTAMTGSMRLEIYQGDSISGATSPLYTSDAVPVDATTSIAGLTVSGDDFTFSLMPPLDLKANKNHWMVLNGNDLVFNGNDVIIPSGTTTSQLVYVSNDSGTSYSVGSQNLSFQVTAQEVTAAAVFTGVIIGDTPTSDKNVVTFLAQPLSDLFRQYPARLLNGYTSTGLTASQFVESVRDHTDGSGNFVFRPFFGDTTANWNIQTTTVLYGELNTSTGEDIIDQNVWTIVEKLAQAETFVPYVGKDGVFNFVDRAEATATSFEFHGARSLDREYGRTIKTINAAGPKYSKYYSRVNVRWDDAFTQTSVETVEATFEVTSNNLPWIYGHRTFDFTNRWIASGSVAAQIAQTIFNDVSVLKDEIEFSASFVPQLEIFDKISITYNNVEFSNQSLWDVNRWSRAAGFESDFGLNGTKDNASIMFNPSWYFAGAFTPTTTAFIISKIRAPLYYNGSPSTLGGYLIPEIWSDASSLPSAMIFQGSTATLVSLDLTATNAQITSTSSDNWAEFTFTDGAELSPGTRYWFVLRPDYVETADIAWQTVSNSTSFVEIGKLSFASGTSWGNASRPFFMHIFGLNGPVEPEVSLIWDEEKGDSLNLQDAQFSLLKIELDLDKLETKVQAREV